MLARTVSLFATALGCATVPTASSIVPEQTVTESSPTAPAEPQRVMAADTFTPAATSVVEPNAVAAPAARVEQTAPVEYRTPLLDEPSLARAARAACTAALASERPLLLEFSAPWCEDCLALERSKAVAPLAQELQRWELLVINVGGGFEHPALMRVFRVDAIAKLVVVAPRSCAEPLTSWTQGRSRTLDGAAKQKGGVGAELSSWLAEERTRAARAGSAP